MIIIRKCYFLLLFLSSFSYAQEIAITFDDAPMGNGPIFTGAERTEKILQHLSNHRVDQVAFFVVTAFIDEPGLQRLKKYGASGHLLANHTHSHAWIHQIGTAGYIEDVRKAHHTLKTMQGFTPWFRYPFLDEGRTKPVRDSIRNALREMDLTNGYVTIDNYDWYLNHLLKKAISEGKKVDYEKFREVYLEHIWNSIAFYHNIAKRINRKNTKHVLLLHENDLSAYFLGDLIRYIKSNGWKIISPTEAYQDPIADRTPDVLFNGQGRVAAIAADEGLPVRELVQHAEDELYLDKLFTERKIFK